MACGAARVAASEPVGVALADARKGEELPVLMLGGVPAPFQLAGPPRIRHQDALNNGVTPLAYGQFKAYAEGQWVVHRPRQRPSQASIAAFQRRTHGMVERQAELAIASRTIKRWYSTGSNRPCHRMTAYRQEAERAVCARYGSTSGYTVRLMYRLAQWLAWRDDRREYLRKAVCTEHTDCARDDAVQNGVTFACAVRKALDQPKTRLADLRQVLLDLVRDVELEIERTGRP
jgi:hypothetical protein